MGESEEYQQFWKQRWRKIKQKRAFMHHQVAAAHNQLETFYELGRARLVADGRLSAEEAERFARIDARLLELQKKPRQLEFYENKKQFHEEWIQKHFAMKPGV